MSFTICLYLSGVSIQKPKSYITNLGVVGVVCLLGSSQSLLFIITFQLLLCRSACIFVKFIILFLTNRFIIDITLYWLYLKSSNVSKSTPSIYCITNTFLLQTIGLGTIINGFSR